MGQLLDKNVLQNLAMLSEDDESSFLNEVIDIFLDTSPPLFQELYQSISKSDERQVQYYAHRLKGLCANIGAVDLQKVFAEIEDSGATYEQAGDIEGHINSIFQETKTQLESEWRR